MNQHIHSFGKKPKKPDLEIKTLFSGEMRCVLNEGTDDEVDTGWFHNLILDGGLDRLGSSSSSVMFPWTSIGTGTTAPANGQSSLVSYVASTSTIISNSTSAQGSTPFVSQATMAYQYPQGAVVGNMAEIGIGWAAGGGSLWSRALILDGGGAPTTLTVTSLDQLTVYYKLTCAPQITDLTGTVSISGTSYNYTGRLGQANGFFSNMYAVLNNGGGGRFAVMSSSGGPSVHAYSTQTLGALTSLPAGTSYAGANSAPTLGSYTAGQKYLDNTFAVLPSECNAPGGIGAFTIEFTLSQMYFQYTLAAASGGATLPKDNTKTWGMTVRFSWDRV